MSEDQVVNNNQFLAALNSLEDAVKWASADAPHGAVSPVSIVAAVRVLVLVLNAGFVPPDFVVDLDGEIEMNWTLFTGRWLSVTVASTGHLIYAWVLNGAHGCRVSVFDGAALPLELTEKLSAVTCAA